MIHLTLLLSMRSEYDHAVLEKELYSLLGYIDHATELAYEDQLAMLT
jgi:hypothetical protein